MLKSEFCHTRWAHADKVLLLTLNRGEVDSERTRKMRSLHRVEKKNGASLTYHDRDGINFSHYLLHEFNIPIPYPPVSGIHGLWWWVDAASLAVEHQKRLEETRRDIMAILQLCDILQLGIGGARFKHILYHLILDNMSLSSYFATLDWFYEWDAQVLKCDIKWTKWSYTKWLLDLVDCQAAADLHCTKKCASLRAIYEFTMISNSDGHHRLRTREHCIVLLQNRLTWWAVKASAQYINE